MKKNILLIALLLMLAVPAAMAGPAYPGKINYTQPDGSVIVIVIHGDEFGHWVTDEWGNILEQDADGYWKNSTKTSKDIDLLMKEADARRAAATDMRKAASTSANFGSPKIPVILVGFKDKAFTKTAADFNAMLNSQGYSANNAIGSVLDYYTENSLGQFTPVFEVLGPVQLDNNMSYYGGNNSSGDDKLPELALVHAANKLDASVDFSRYDNDGDGTVDFIMFYFAGYDEAQGGSTDCIWSHAWYLSNSSNVTTNDRTHDGVKLNRYFCTAELKGSSGSTMCSIGTTCHEFAHTLGLPDFYDTDYSTNGTAASMYNFDLMASGSYNGDSTTPPYFSAEELVEVGWLSAIPEISSTGSYTLPSVNYPGATGYSAYKTSAAVSGEYFVYEVRGGQRWDAEIPTGLMVYHVDKSSNTVSGSVKASSVWNSNKVNAYSAHPCCYVVPAAKPTQTTVYSGSGWMFGTTYRSYTPTAWSGNTIGNQLSNITYSNGSVTFSVVNTNAKGIAGRVTDSDGNPISGATVSTSIFVTTTDANGDYSFELSNGGEYSVTASKTGYVTKSVDVTVARIETVNFSLLREGESLPSVLATYPDGTTWDYYGSSNYSYWDIYLANIYPATYLAAYSGKQIKTISFLSGDDGIENCHVVIDYGDARHLALPVSNVNAGDWTTVDIVDKDIIIPSGKDVFIGYGGRLMGNYPIPATDELAASDLIGYTADFATNTVNTPSDWEAETSLVFAISITVGDYVAPDTGYNHIDDPKNGVYRSGDVFALSLVETTGNRQPQTAISWYVDDELVTASSVTLTSGSHTIEAHFTTNEGHRKVVELPLTVS